MVEPVKEDTGDTTKQERQQLMAEVDERKRKILRDVEVCVRIHNITLQDRPQLIWNHFHTQWLLLQ